MVTVDGDDYRHRGVEFDTRVALGELPAGNVTDDDFSAVLAHLATIHQGTYRELVRGLDAVVWRDVGPVPDEFSALRLVVLIDRLYDEDVPVRAQGTWTCSPRRCSAAATARSTCGCCRAWPSWCTPRSEAGADP